MTDFSRVCVRVTNRCNMKCGFCLADPTDYGEMTATDIVRALGRLVSRSRLRALCISGGEPLLRPDLGEILAGAHRLGLHTTVTSNGLLISEDDMAMFRRYGIRVKVSLYGQRETHNRLVGADVFDQVDGKIVRMLQRGVTVSVNTLVTKANLHAPEEVVPYAEARQLHSVRVLLFIPRGTGYLQRDHYMLTLAQVSDLEQRIAHLAADAAGRGFGVYYSNYFKTAYVVLETDGHLTLEGGYQAEDRILQSFSKSDPCRSVSAVSS